MQLSLGDLRTHYQEDGTFRCKYTHQLFRVISMTTSKVVFAKITHKDRLGRQRFMDTESFRKQYRKV